MLPSRNMDIVEKETDIKNHSLLDGGGKSPGDISLAEWNARATR